MEGGSLLLKGILSFVAKLKEHVWFCFFLMHGRSIVTLSLSQYQNQCRSKSRCRIQQCLTDCISGKAMMWSDSFLAVAFDGTWQDE